MNIKSRLAVNGVELLASCEVKEIRGSKVNLVIRGGEQWREGIDTIVLTVGVASRNSLFEEIRKQVQSAYLIGDATKPGNALSAIQEGEELGRLI